MHYDEEPKFEIGQTVRLLGQPHTGKIIGYNPWINYYTLEVNPDEFFFPTIEIGEAYIEALNTATPIAIMEVRCTCGAESVSAPGHSRWCDVVENRGGE